MSLKEKLDNILPSSMGVRRTVRFHDISEILHRVSDTRMYGGGNLDTYVYHRKPGKFINVSAVEEWEIALSYKPAVLGEDPLPHFNLLDRPICHLVGVGSYDPWHYLDIFLLERKKRRRYITNATLWNLHDRLYDILRRDT